MKITNRLIALSILFFSAPAYAQMGSPSTFFASIAEAENGDILVTGPTVKRKSSYDSNGNPRSEIMVLRFKRDSLVYERIIDNELFKGLFTGYSGGGAGNLILETKEKEVFVLAYIPYGGSALIKMAGDGGIEWFKYLDLHNEEGNYFFESGNHFIMVGTKHNGKNRTFSRILKLDKKGNILTDKILFSDPGLHSAHLTNMVEHAGSFYIFGKEADSTHDKYSYDPENYKTVIYKLSCNFEVEWKKYYQQDSVYEEDIISARFSADGNIYLLTEFNVKVSYREHASLVKLNASGEMIWRRMIPCHYSQLVISKDSALYAVGYSMNLGVGLEADLRVEKYNMNGDLLWGKAFGTPWIDAAMISVNLQKEHF
jgi:hypothetical protein